MTACRGCWIEMSESYLRERSGFCKTCAESLGDCFSCRWLHRRLYSYKGVCRRYPPTRGGFPEVGCDDSCGEYEFGADTLKVTFEPDCVECGLIYGRMHYVDAKPCDACKDIYGERNAGEEANCSTCSK